MFVYPFISFFPGVLLTTRSLIGSMKPDHTIHIHSSKLDFEKGVRATGLKTVSILDRAKYYERGKEFPVLSEPRLYLNGLGKTSNMSNLLSKIHLNSEVKVRQQDSTTVTGQLTEKFKDFVDDHFPKGASSFIRFPNSFQYRSASLNNTEGFPDAAEARSDINNSWKIQAHQATNEENVFNMLVRDLTNRAALMFNRYDSGNIFKVVQEDIRIETRNIRQINPQSLDVPLSQKEKELASIKGVDVTQLDEEVKLLVNDLFSNTDDMASEELIPALEHQLKKKQYRPGFNQLSDKQKTKYAINMVTSLKERLLKVFPNEESLKGDPSKAGFNKKPSINTQSQGTVKISKEDVTNSMNRHLVNLMQIDSSFDFLVTDKSSSTVLQMLICSGRFELDGLRDKIKKSTKLLAKGDQLFHHVLAPAANLSSGWTKVGVLCFPDEATKEPFKKLGLEDNQLPYVITQEEMKSSKWLEDLNLGNTVASDEEYVRLFSWVVGSVYVSVESQTFNYNEEVTSTNQRISGPRQKGDVVGVGPGTLDEIKEVTFKELKGKPLGHLHSVLFWNEEQMDTIEILKTEESILIVADYGVGKTALLMAAARQEAENPDITVYFILATATDTHRLSQDTPYILDIAIKEKFEGSKVKVMTISDIREELQMFPNDSVHKLIQEFVKRKGNRFDVKFFVDEFPVSQEDKAMFSLSKQSTLTKTLGCLEEGSRQCWVALRTVDIQDTGHHLDSQLQMIKKLHLSGDFKRKCVMPYLK